jgi:hypothetical protein
LFSHLPFGCHGKLADDENIANASTRSPVIIETESQTEREMREITIQSVNEICMACPV